MKTLLVLCLATVGFAGPSPVLKKSWSNTTTIITTSIIITTITM